MGCRLKEEIDLNKEAKAIIVIISALSLIIITAYFFCTGAKKENEIMSYSIIVINGEEFSTSDIKNVSYSSGYSRQVKIEFKDGMVAYTDCYILKDN